jgi:two-component system CheB/CheR fusion protein
MQAELMRGGHLSAAQMERAVAIIERGTKLQVQLIDDLLDVSRIVAGKMKVELEPVDPCLAIQAAIDGVSETAQRKSIVLQTGLDDTIGDVWGDPTRIQQVVSNLLTNAIKFTPAAGEISVGLAAVDGYAQLTVRDSGMGIDPLFLPHIFDRFSQKDGSTTRKYGGLGLGLAIVRYLVEAQGGRVTAESEGLGKGATFTVTFALTTLAVRSHEAHAPAEAKPASPLDRPGSLRTYAALHGLRVLVVDDDPSTLDAIADVLRLSGAVARAASSSAAALQVLETFSPDVIICDIAMPGEDGHAFIRKLRARGADVPALALTALSSAEDRRSALASGFQMHMTKPIDIDRLRDGILGLIQLGSRTVGQA